MTIDLACLPGDFAMSKPNVLTADPDRVAPSRAPTGGLQALVCLSRAEALRDSVTNTHEELVGVVTTELCLALGLDKRQSESIGEAARLHDIGKVALPSDILHKPGRLSPEEWAFVRKHSTIGYGILRIDESPFLRLAAMLALFHHEHFDGSGYPHGVAGEMIPFEARIIAVADTYEALRANRAYKYGVDHETAIRTILEGDERSSPSQFDPQVLTALKTAEATIAARYEAAQAALSEAETDKGAGP